METAKHRVVVIGAGGIGGYYGARLAAAGHDVTFVARGAHLEALNTGGLTVTHPDFRFAGPVRAVELAELVTRGNPSDVDFLLLCTKADTTEPIAHQLKNWYDNPGAVAPIVSLQNGVDNERELAQVLDPALVIGGLAVRIGAHVVAPGQIEATGVGQLILGVWPNADEAPPGAARNEIDSISAALRSAEIPVQVSPQIRRELWRKLIINNGVNPLSALVQRDTRSLTEDPGLKSIVRGLMQEAASAANADGETLSSAEVDEMFDLISTFDAIKTSMLVDREKGRPMEIDAICGVVLDRSSRLGIDAPYTRTVSTLLRQVA